MTFPSFGVLYVKILFSIFANSQKDVEVWAGVIILIAVISFLATYTQKVCFGIVSETMTKEIRRELYHSMLRKHIGWYDLRENSLGVLTSILSSDVYALNGASTEGLSTIIETFTGLIGALILAFTFDWRITL